MPRQAPWTPPAASAALRPLRSAAAPPPHHKQLQLEASRPALPHAPPWRGRRPLPRRATHLLRRRRRHAARRRGRAPTRSRCLGPRQWPAPPTPRGGAPTARGSQGLQRWARRAAAARRLRRERLRSGDLRDRPCAARPPRRCVASAPGNAERSPTGAAPARTGRQALRADGFRSGLRKSSARLLDEAPRSQPPQQPVPMLQRSSAKGDQSGTSPAKCLRRRSAFCSLNRSSNCAVSRCRD
mmetsp:Transcript_68599/g.199053  ORF Transcript_68599/g.199053 Transcript_68599/m.199053 type:complete len:241 (+) Transcript_68599:1022-1744(+)